MAGEMFVAEESVSYEPPDPNEMEAEIEPKDKESDEPEEKPKEKPEPEKKPAGEKPEEKPEEAKKPELPKGARKRINKLTARNYQLKKELAEKEKKLAELEALKGEKKLIEEIADHEKTKPVKGEFESYEDYIDAKSKWEAKAAYLEGEKGKSPKKAQEKQEEENNFDEVLEDVFRAGRDAYDDFEEIVQAQSLKLTETMVLAVLDTDASHEILYYLGSNPDESAKIAAMTPLQQAREIGKLESKIVKEDIKPKEEKTLDLSEQKKPPEAEEKPKEKTKAPPPIESVHGKSVTKKDPEKMTNEEFREYRGYDRKGQRKG